MVFFHHCAPRSTDGQPSCLWFPIKLFSWGWVGVDLFFVLSGFLITFLLINESTLTGTISISKFYMRRILRIWPLYFAVLLGVALYPLCLHHWNSAYRHFLECVIVPFFLFLGNFAVMWHTADLITFANSWGLSWALYVALIEPFWSLCIEEQFYLFWPSVLKCVKGAKRLFLIATAIGVFSLIVRFALVTIAIKNHFGTAVYYLNTISHFDALMVGAGLAIAEYSFPGWFRSFVDGVRGRVLTIILSVTMLSIVLFCPSIFEENISIVPIMSIIAICFGLLLLLTMNWQPMKSLFSLPLFTSIGKVSYAMYVFHFACIGISQTFTPQYVNNPALTWICLAVTAFAVSYVTALASWHLIELRVLKLRSRFRPSFETHVREESLKKREEDLAAAV